MTKSDTIQKILRQALFLFIALLIFVFLHWLIIVKILPIVVSHLISFWTYLTGDTGASQLAVALISLLAAIGGVFASVILYHNGIKRKNGLLLKQMGNELVHEFFIPYEKLCQDIYDVFGMAQDGWEKVTVRQIGNILRRNSFPDNLPYWDEHKQDVWAALYEMDPKLLINKKKTPKYWNEYIELDSFMELVYSCESGRKGVYRFVDPNNALIRSKVKRTLFLKKTVGEIYYDPKYRNMLMSVKEGITILVDIYDMKGRLTQALDIDNALKYIEIYEDGCFPFQNKKVRTVKKYSKESDDYIVLLRKMKDKLNKGV